MRDEEKTIDLISRAETNIATVEKELDQRHLFHLTGELQAVNEILENIVKNSQESI